MKKIHHIAVTGGPCGGKSSTLPYLKKKLSDKGFKVLVMPEVATLVIESGILYGENISKYHFQKIVLEMILALENAARTFAENYTGEKEIICLYDRGIADIMVYLKDEDEFRKLLSEYNLDIGQIFTCYSGVVHMVSAAIGAEEAYTTANNAARRETLEEAAALDTKTLNAWVGHPKLHIITNTGDFESKKAAVLEAVLSIVGTVEIERSFITKIPKDAILKAFSANTLPCSLTEITQTYTRDSRGFPVRLRKEVSGTSTTYTQTVKRKLPDGSTSEHEMKIPKQQYDMKVNTDIVFGKIQKRRLYCVCEYVYFSVDFYESSHVEFSRLEVEFSSLEDSKKFSLPKKLLEILPDLREVTGKDEYSNYSIACNSGI